MRGVVDLYTAGVGSLTCMGEVMHGDRRGRRTRTGRGELAPPSDPRPASGRSRDPGTVAFPDLGPDCVGRQVE